MYVREITKSSYQRLLYNDNSGKFKIIIQAKYNKITDDNFGIQEEKQKQIIMNTTVNKARILSRLINEQYKNDSNLDAYVFDFGTIDENEINEIANILQALIESNGDNVMISEKNRDIFYLILCILGNENDIKEQIITSNVTECKYLYNDMFNGIISYIQQITRDIVNGNNDHLRLSGIGQHRENALENIIRYDKKNIDKLYSNIRFNLMPTSEDYIEFNFVNRKVFLTGYAIRTATNMIDYYQPKTWKIIGSEDGINWETIDMKENNEELNGINRCQYFECINPRKFFKYIRYVQLANWDGNRYYGQYKYYILLSAIEFFGYITN